MRPHTGGNQLPEPTDITSAGGFPIHEEQPQIYITSVPDAKDLRDYILITPIPSLPVIYVYLSESAGDKGEEKPKNIKMLDDKYLKGKGIDAHEIKSEFLGGNAEIKKYDLYVDKDSGQIWIFRKGGKGNGIPTGEYIN